MTMDVKKIRKDFPVLNRKIDGKQIIYFDNACMTLKPKQVIKTIEKVYLKYPACAGRSIHKLGSEITIKYEEAREKIQKFINAEQANEIIFTRNTTEGINLISRCFNFKKGDVVLTTDREHNSNLVPWHIQKKQRGIEHKIIRSKKDNTFDIEKFENQINKKVKLVSMVHTSNLDGYTIPAERIIKIAHDYGALVLLDGAQSASRNLVDVQKLDIDFFAFAFHKMLGPMGVGVLYGKNNLLNDLEPFIVGGNTVETCSYNSSTFLDSPEKFEAGLQNYAGAIGAGAAVDYITHIGKDNIKKHEYLLNKLVTEKLIDMSDLELIGPKDPSLRSGIFTFNIKNTEPHSIAMFFDDANIMLRSGVFCVHSWFNAHNLKGAARASFFIYNTNEECKIFIEKIKEIIKE